MSNGLFAVNGRDPDKIRQKQYDVITKLPRVGPRFSHLLFPPQRGEVLLDGKSGGVVGPPKKLIVKVK